MLFYRYSLLKLILKELLLKFHDRITRHEILLSCDIGSDFISMSLNPKLYGFFKGSCFLCSKAPLACFPTVWNVGGTTSKICRQQRISVPTTKKKGSVTRFCDFGLLFNGLHSWQTTNPDQIHKTTTSQKQRRKSMQSF